MTNKLLLPNHLHRLQPQATIEGVARAIMASPFNKVQTLQIIPHLLLQTILQ
jgi:hypothetical protein